MKLQEFIPTGYVFDLILSAAHTWRRVGYIPNLSNPQKFNEIVLSNKVNFSGDLALARKMTDKVEIKAHLKEIGMPELIIPTLGVFDQAEDLAQFSHDDKFILKPSHGSGSVIIKDGRIGEKLRPEEISAARRWLKENYYLRGREINYKGLKPRIIIESMLSAGQGEDLKDFKVFCSSGRPFMIQVDHDRFTNHTRQLYTPDWDLLPFSMAYPRKNDVMPAPMELKKMLDYARNLSSGFGFVRVDFYIAEEGLKLGEMTFFPGNCAERFTPESGDLQAGLLAKSTSMT